MITDKGKGFVVITSCCWMSSSMLLMYIHGARSKQGLFILMLVTHCSTQSSLVKLYSCTLYLNHLTAFARKERFRGIHSSSHSQQTNQQSIAGGSLTAVDRISANLPPAQFLHDFHMQAALQHHPQENHQHPLHHKLQLILHPSPCFCLNSRHVHYSLASRSCCASTLLLC